MSSLMRERIGKVFLLQSYDYSVVVAGFLMLDYIPQQSHKACYVVLLMSDVKNYYIA